MIAEKPQYHTDRIGNKTLISKLETLHLKNIIKRLERMSKEGFVVRQGGGSTPDDMWYDEDCLLGREALDALNYNAYKNELLRRQRKTI